MKEAGLGRRGVLLEEAIRATESRQTSGMHSTWWLHWQSFIQRVDSLEQIIAPRGECTCEDRVGSIGAVKHLEAMFFTGNVGIEQPDSPVELVNHVDYLRCLPFCSRARIKMTLVSHCMLQDEPVLRD
jgi:hypothetical protein